MADQEILTKEDIAWMKRILGQLDIPQAQELTMEDVLQIQEEEVEECLSKIYGEDNNRHKLSSMEKRCIYLIHKNGK